MLLSRQVMNRACFRFRPGQEELPGTSSALVTETRMETFCGPAVSTTMLYVTLTMAGSGLVLLRDIEFSNLELHAFCIGTARRPKKLGICVFQQLRLRMPD